MSKKTTKKKVVKPSSKKVVVNRSSKKKLAPTTSKSKANNTPKQKEELIFNRQNYLMMIAGAVLVGLGLLMMTGGSMPDPNTWDPNIIYSKRITLLAPMIILAGLILEIFAIFKRPKLRQE